MDVTNNAPAAPAGDPLAAIAAEGAALEQQQLTAAPGAAPAEEEKATPAQMWAMVPRTLGSVLSMAFPELRAVYTDQACDLWGQAMVPVASKYGWNIGEDSPEFGLFVASTPLLIGTGVIVMKHRRARQAQGEGQGAGAQRKTPAADDERLPPEV